MDEGGAEIAEDVVAESGLEPAGEEPGEVGAEDRPSAPLESEIAQPTDPQAGVAAARGAERERVLTVETSLYEARVTNRGGRIVSWRLLGFDDDAGEPFEVVAASASEALGHFPLDVSVGLAREDERLRRALYESDGSERLDRVRLGDGEVHTMTLSWSDGAGLEVEKRIVFRGGAYTVGVDVSVKQRGSEVAKAIAVGAGIGERTTESRYRGVEKGIVASRGEVALFDASDIEEGGAGGVSVAATGVASHYFAGILVPSREGFYGSRLESGSVPIPVQDGAQAGERRAITAFLEAPQGPASFTLFLGPKKLEILEELAPGLGGVIEFGDLMRYPALLLRAGLIAIQEYVGNYGWSIVLLTLVINVALSPLKQYSFVSMRKMQKLAPQVQRIRERYKKVKPTDPRYQQMNQEIMGLYKEHKVSPVSGCLPMLLMIPFFFAFYRLLMASIELRQAPFVFWIQDLAQHDPMFALPILMGGSQLAIQKMTPQTSADPMQQRIMALMPVIFTFILAWAPSGLVLYWLSNNIVSMGQQLVTNRYLASKEEAIEHERKAEKAERKRKRKGKKGSKSVTDASAGATSEKGDRSGE
jgi:YidC/Oxa1 family membrane protein insertase